MSQRGERTKQGRAASRGARRALPRRRSGGSRHDPGERPDLPVPVRPGEPAPRRPPLPGPDRSLRNPDKASAEEAGGAARGPGLQPPSGVGSYGGGGLTAPVPGPWPAAARGRSHRGTLRGGGERALAFFTRGQNSPSPFPVQESREGDRQSGAQPRPRNPAKGRPERGCKSALRPASPVPSRARSPFPKRARDPPLRPQVRHSG